MSKTLPARDKFRAIIRLHRERACMTLAGSIFAVLSIGALIFTLAVIYG